MRLASRTAQYVVMSLFAVAFLAPLVWMISASLRPEAKVLSVPPQFLPSDAQWDNYRQIFELIPMFLWNSVKLAGLNVVGILIVASMAGYAFARLRFAGRDLAFMVLLATSIIPGIAYLIPQYIVFRQIGWVDTQYPWNDLFGPLIYINSENLQTLPVALAQFQGEYFTQISLLMCGATVSVVPVIAVFLFAQRYFIQGITMTGMKG